MITHVSTLDDCSRAICGTAIVVGDHQDVFWYPADELHLMSYELQATITCGKCWHELARAMVAEAVKS